MPGMTLKIPIESKAHRTIVQELETRVKLAERGQSEQLVKWEAAESIVAAYVPESADDAQRRVDRDSGKPSYTTIKVPYSYALLMSAHTYWTSVFLGRSPVHQYSGRHGETEQQVLALEALIGYQVDVGGLLAPYYLWLYDVGKYGVGILGEYWCYEDHYFSQLQEAENGEQVYVTQRVEGYKGHKVYNVAPYDFLPDPRVPVNRFQEGEFCAVYREVSWTDLVKKTAQGYYFKDNLDRLKKSPQARKPKNPSRPWATSTLSVSEVGSDENKRPAWVGIFEVYIQLIPSEWNLGKMEMPEKWVFTISADFSTILGAQPLGLLHDKYPFSVLEVEPEAYTLWTRGIPEVVEPIQNTMDWLINSHFYNVRAISNGRFVYDPSRIDASPMESGEPGWAIALRPQAWGSVPNLDAVFKQIDIRDTTSQHFVDFQNMFQIGERAMGISEQVMGALSSGRKTATEVRTSTGFSINRLKTGSELMSAMGFSGHSMKLVQSTQQFYDWSMKIKITGDLSQMAGPQFLMVDPSMIVGAYQFVPVDGSLPVDRFAQATLWKDILGQMSRFPQVMMQYDFAKIFAWVGSLAGVKNMNQFKIQQGMPGMGMPGMNVQVMPDEQLASEAGKGNVIPYPGPGPGPGTQSNVATIPTTNVGLPQ